MAITESDLTALREVVRESEDRMREVARESEDRMREVAREFEGRLGARLDGVEQRLVSATQRVALDAVMPIVSGVTLGLERYLHGQLVDMQADLDQLIDKLDSLEHDVKETRTLVTQTRRDLIKDVRRADAEQQRGVSNATEIEALKYQISKLTERLEALEARRSAPAP